MIATARIQPAETRSIPTGKHDTTNPVDSKNSRLCNFSMWHMTDMAAGFVGVRRDLRRNIRRRFPGSACSMPQPGMARTLTRIGTDVPSKPNTGWARRPGWLPEDTLVQGDVPGAAPREQH